MLIRWKDRVKGFLKYWSDSTLIFVVYMKVDGRESQLYSCINDGLGCILLVERWVDKVIEAIRGCDRVIKLRLITYRLTVTFISAYAPQSGLTDEKKDRFSNKWRSFYYWGWWLQWTCQTSPHLHGFQRLHGGYSFGPRNEEGIQMISLSATNFKKASQPLNHISIWWAHETDWLPLHLATK